MRKINEGTAETARLALLTLVSFCAMLLLGSLVTALLLEVAGVDPLSFVPEELTVGQRNWFRLSLLANNLLLFGGTALVALVLVFRREWPLAAGLATRPRLPASWWALGFFVLSVPVVAYLAFLNLQLELPAWAMRNEAQTNRLLGGILTMDTPGELFLALLTVGVTPALGEELLLRGVLQGRILTPWLRNHHLAIWTAAAVFSGMHLEFAGFLPRLGLGLSLGYAYYWSRSLWVPVVLHFLFNATQVLVTYRKGEFVPDTEVGELPPWWLLAVALVLGILAWWRAEQEARPRVQA
ncbi:MAG: CPBP family intramembrane glutamic endopeptidase [Bacteroidota bacterium]